MWDNPAAFRTSNAVYQELAEGITSGKLDAKRVYLDDRPAELDLTLCILDAAPVLAIARRRKDHGQHIARLLATLENATAPSSDEKPSRRRGRIPRPVWKAATAKAMQWLDGHGYPELGDGGQANLERHIADWLAQRGHHPAESTVRSHVVKWLDEFRAGLASTP